MTAKERELANEIVEQVKEQLTGLNVPKGIIYGKMIQVMRDVEAIAKTREKNSQVPYAFRGVESVMNVLHPILAENGIFVMPFVIDLKNQDYAGNNGKFSHQAILTMGYRFYAEDGSFVECSYAAESIDFSDKATQQAGSYCFKDALLKSFCVPTQETQNDGDGKQTAAEGVKMPPQQGRLAELPKLADISPPRQQAAPPSNVTQMPAPAPPVQQAPEPQGVIETAKAQAGTQVTPPEAWTAIKNKLGALTPTPDAFHQWSVITLRQNAMTVPKNLGDLPIEGGEFLFKVAVQCKKAKTLLHNIPAAVAQA